MAWSHAEIPPEEFDRRIAAATIAMRARQLDAMFVYTNFARPSAVSQLTHFIPYWNQAVLVVEPARGAVLVAGLSERVAEWIRDTSRLDDIICTQDFGVVLANRLTTLRKDGRCRIGVVELAGFPEGILAAVRRNMPGATFVDATDLLNQVIADNMGDDHPAELCLAERAIAIAHAAVAAAGAAAIRAADANLVIAAAEREARCGGAEEVLIAVAPDVLIDPRLRRIEGTSLLGPVIALQVSVAYKGQWTRLGRTLGRTASEPFADMAAWFEGVLSDDRLTIQPGSAIDAKLDQLPGVTREFWRIEGASGGLPLAVLAGSPPFGEPSHPLHGFLTLSVRLRRPDGWWYAASPLPLRSRRDAGVHH